MFDPVTEYDFIIYSDDKTSIITITLEEYLHQRLPSLSCTIEVLDNKFKAWNINVWFALEELLSFISKLEKLEKTRQGNICLKAMTPEDFSITFENYNNKGDFAIHYSLTNNRKYFSEIKMSNTLTGGFKIDSEFLFKILSDFKHLASVAELEMNIDFTT
ncbi:WapI family immunity protein [Chengkuizengella marina]|uniref:Uncharacterized protein n=1 Tax=Chengkuizengella marina TaxID=2507566 RepID=A0A6N9Q7Z9_9BACL|nr:hypothetical protein [Chengkuizengella marina]NBI30744.1 hypothetical protein [Chengkuizengella marina]